MQTSVLSCEFIHHTHAAVKVNIEDVISVKDQWIPKSVIENVDDLEDAEKGDHLDLEIKQWWLENEGLD